MPQPTFDRYPKRIVCLTEETTETLYRLGEQDRIVGISGFTVRPPEARREKPKVSTFLDAKIEEIVALRPDLVIGFSDIQADIARELIAAGITVWVNNHRSVEGILDMIAQLGALVGKSEAARELIAGIEAEIERIRAVAASWPRRPRVYFEEWFDPLITGIEWVSEMVTIAGGEDIFPEHFGKALARDRILADPAEVVARDPDLILASWCGKMVKPERIRARPGWADMRAVRAGAIHEIKSAIILQPGPAALIDGLPIVHGILRDWVEKNKSSVHMSR